MEDILFRYVSIPITDTNWREIRRVIETEERKGKEEAQHSKDQKERKTSAE